MGTRPPTGSVVGQALGEAEAGRPARGPLALVADRGGREPERFPLPLDLTDVGGDLGLLPLRRPAEHAGEDRGDGRGGLVTVAGGKLTTWRQMAEDTVDEVLDRLGQRASCRTKDLRLRGAEGWDEVSAGPLDDAVRDHLAGRFGAEAATVIGLIADDPSLGEPVEAGAPYLRAEVVYAATHEMATSVDDVLGHRTRARLLARDASAEAAPAVAALLAGVLGWSPEREQAEVAAYVGEIEREREALGLTAAPVGDERERAPGWTPGLRLPKRLAAN